MYRSRARQIRRALLGTSLLISVLYAPSVCAASTITITKATLEEKVSPYAEVLSGFADSGLGVYFRADATCTCSCTPDLTYTWYFGDTQSATGKNQTHVYSSNHAGNRYPLVIVECNDCEAMVNSLTLFPLCVSVIDGIRVDRIGDKTNPGNDGRLCFNNERRVKATALPAGVSGSGQIDWSVQVGTEILDVPNNAGSDLTTSPTIPELEDGDWPTSNAAPAWGAITLYISIDGPLVSGQEGEMTLTGAVSYVANDKSIKKFYEAEDDDCQNPSSDPNWYYYYTNALGNGPHSYDSSAGYGGCLWLSQPTYVEIGPLANDVHPRVEDIEYINLFNDVALHEKWHKLHRDHNYDEHGGDGYVPAADESNGADDDDVCSSNCPDNGGGWEAIYGTDFDDATTNGTTNDREWIAQQQEPHSDNTNKDWAHPGAQW